MESEYERGVVLVVDDDGSTREVLREALQNRGFEVHLAASAEAAEALLTDVRFEAVLTDLRMGRGSGFDVVESARRLHPGVPVLVLTAFGSIQLAVDAVKRGAFDFLSKPFDLEVVTVALDRAVRHARLSRELDALRELVGGDGVELLGQSAAMQHVGAMIERVARTDATVLITGESGTGKELVARTLHARSPRCQGPFVAVNCAALPEALLESELFGHARGSFTDARSARAGLFVSAGRGTLFLDEVGEMPPAMQAKLLRAIEQRTVRPVGADRDVPFDARLVTATHRDLEEEVEAKRFRQDLFFRLQVLDIALPPLRARGSDVLLLAMHFLRVSARRHGRSVPTLDPEVGQLFLRHDWPGNVRELANTVERAVALSAGPVVTRQDLPERLQRIDANSRRVVLSVEEPDDLVTLEEMERRYVGRVLEAVRGNKRLAAELLGLDRSTLYRKLERWGR
jgi:DNA-binding NtrC family response regulator